MGGIYSGSTEAGFIGLGPTTASCQGDIEYLGLVEFSPWQLGRGLQEPSSRQEIDSSWLPEGKANP